MGLDILTNHNCPICGERLHINRSNGGDWFSTIIGFVCQSYCTNCGVMEPLVEDDREFAMTFLSNNCKRKVAIRLATKFGFHYEETKEVAKSIVANDEYSFSETFAIEISKKNKLMISKEDIKKLFF